MGRARLAIQIPEDRYRDRRRTYADHSLLAQILSRNRVSSPNPLLSLPNHRQSQSSNTTPIPSMSSPLSLRSHYQTPTPHPTPPHLSTSRTQLTFQNPSHSWIPTLPTHFLSASFTVLDHHHESPSPIYRKPWNEDNLMGMEAFSDVIPDEAERKLFRGMHRRCVQDVARGWWGGGEIVVVVGRREG